MTAKVNLCPKCGKVATEMHYVEDSPHGSPDCWECEDCYAQRSSSVVVKWSARREGLVPMREYASDHSG